MKIRESKIPKDINYLDHWLYEMRRIYDEVDDNNEEDWSNKKKKKRIN